ncbi:hypothetical protein AGMMS50276_14520 [Synergistales bacterium]|nr:hypothetical protein AGMMS50276_14520 [Synergistales bacterium]
MKKAVIFGAGTLGRIFYQKVKGNIDVLFVVDNDVSKWSTQETAGGGLP